MAELVDAQVSGTCGSDVVEVRVFSWAPAFANAVNKGCCLALRSPRLGKPLFKKDMPMASPDIKLHHGDIPEGLNFGPIVAVDTESLGLSWSRDRLCLVQLSAGDDTAHIVQFAPNRYDCPNLKKLMADTNVTKLFHFARADLAMISHYIGVMPKPVYCTKIASVLARTFTDRHSLKDLAKDLLGLDLAKEQQTSDWGSEKLTPEQLRYAASDVLYLHRIKAKLDDMLARENREHLAKAAFEFLPGRAELDLAGWENIDIFAHRPQRQQG